MTKSEMTALAQRQLEAYNRRLLSEFCACFHEDVQILNLVSGVIRCEGKVQFEANYKELFAQSPKLKCELKSRIVLESAVVDEEWVTGSARFPDGIHVVAIYGFRDGLIDRVWFPL